MLLAQELPREIAGSKGPIFKADMQPEVGVSKICLVKPEEPGPPASVTPEDVNGILLR